MLCSKQVDLIGKECLEMHKYTYLYKGEVEIPPLTMVDDVLLVAECGYKSVMANSYMNCQTISKKLQFGAEKCKKLHVGKYQDKYKCPTLCVDNWKETETRNETTGGIEIEDICIGEAVMEEKYEECYLGDIISKDGKNIKNIQARTMKGKGIVQRISNILEGIPFGKMFFEVAKILRNSLLISSLICNSEAWFRISKPELELLKSVDLMLLRKILEAPKSTPKEMIYLELGIVHIREIIRQRRLNFLHYILNQENDSIMFRVFEKQSKNKSKHDWVTTICNDLEEIGLSVTFEEIQKMSRRKWKSMVKVVTEKKALIDLNETKNGHSKVKQIKYEKLEMQAYFLPNRLKVSKEEILFIFKMRCKVVNNIKMNQQNNYEHHECRFCFTENETQEHLYQCKEIWKFMKNEFESIPKYEKIIEGSIREKIQVVRIFRQLMEQIK